VCWGGGKKEDTSTDSRSSSRFSFARDCNSAVIDLSLLALTYTVINTSHNHAKEWT
jgi:hypothetical protein